MRGHILIGRVQIGLVAVRVCHAAFQVVGHDDLADAIKELKRTHVGADPIGQRLGPGRFGKRVVGRTEHGNEDLRGA